MNGTMTEVEVLRAESQDSRKHKPATEQQGYWLDWPGGRVNPDWKGWQREPVKAKARKKGDEFVQAAKNAAYKGEWEQLEKVMRGWW